MALGYLAVLAGFAIHHWGTTWVLCWPEIIYLACAISLSMASHRPLGQWVDFVVCDSAKMGNLDRTRDFVVYMAANKWNICLVNG